MQTPLIKVKFLHPQATVPKSPRAADACQDICFRPKYNLSRSLWPGETAVLETGLAFEIPEGWEAQIRPRSGLAANHGITVLNTPGTIDSNYRGELKIILYNASSGESPVRFGPGDRIAQIAFRPTFEPCFEVVNELSPSERGDKGFGSSGV